MKTVLIIVALLVVALVVFVVYRLARVKRRNNKRGAEHFARVKELYDALESGQALTEEDVLPFARNIQTRETAFQLLADHGKTNLFPEAYNTLIAGAESNLANWLVYPTELDAFPDEIAHVKPVSFDFDGQNNLVHYEVFKCRVNEPHWAAKDGWFLGVVGPYFDDSKPYVFPQATFSRISSTVDKVTAEEEARWVHENIALRR